MAVLPSPVQFIASVPPVTRGFTGLTVICSLLYFWLHLQNNESSTPYLTLIPGSSLFYPWTFLTSALVETSVFEFIASMIFVPPSLRYLERLWGSVELLKFIAVSVAIPNVIAFAFNWIEFVATKDADLFLYGMQYHGQMALQTAILVAFTQLIPEHQVQILGVIKARVKKIPMAYLTISTVMTIIGFQCPWIVIQFGWLVAWIYLRFYKRNTGDVVGGGDAYGDRSETFAFIYWFPPFAHYPITLLSNFAHHWATRLHLIPTSGSDLESGNYNQLPGSARAEAERRRAMALKALDQRLANSSPASSSIPLQSQPPRPPPAAASSKADGSSMPSAPTTTRTNEKDKRSLELDESAASR